MLEKLFYDFFFLNLNSYENIGINFYINIFLLVLTLALSVAFFAVNIHRQTTQLIVMQLVRNKANGEESAKTLTELGMMKSFFVRWTITRSSVLRGVVARVGEVSYTYDEYVALTKKKGGFKEEKIDLETAKFYIKSEGADRAQQIIETYGTSMVRCVLYCVFFLAIYICLSLCMPEILSLINGWLAKLPM